LGENLSREADNWTIVDDNFPTMVQTIGRSRGTLTTRRADLPKLGATPANWSVSGAANPVNPPGPTVDNSGPSMMSSCPIRKVS
jgi:hypothetical protein